MQSGICCAYKNCPINIPSRDVLLNWNKDSKYIYAEQKHLKGLVHLLMFLFQFKVRLANISALENFTITALFQLLKLCSHSNQKYPVLTSSSLISSMIFACQLFQSLFLKGNSIGCKTELGNYCLVACSSAQQPLLWALPFPRPLFPGCQAAFLHIAEQCVLWGVGGVEELREEIQTCPSHTAQWQGGGNG